MYIYTRNLSINVYACGCVAGKRECMYTNVYVPVSMHTNTRPKNTYIYIYIYRYICEHAH